MTHPSFSLIILIGSIKHMPYGYMFFIPLIGSDSRNRKKLFVESEKRTAIHRRRNRKDAEDGSEYDAL